MTKIEKIQDLLGNIELDIRNGVITEILETLKEFAQDPEDPDEHPGMIAAIEIVEANFPIMK